jgi:hypothetical protein
MTPREVEDLHPEEFRALIEYQNNLAREERKAMNRAERRRR